MEDDAAIPMLPVGECDQTRQELMAHLKEFGSDQSSPQFQALLAVIDGKVVCALCGRPLVQHKRSEVPVVESPSPVKREPVLNKNEDYVPPPPTYTAPYSPPAAPQPVLASPAEAARAPPAAPQPVHNMARHLDNGAGPMNVLAPTPESHLKAEMGPSVAYKVNPGPLQMPMGEVRQFRPPVKVGSMCCIVYLGGTGLFIFFGISFLALGFCKDGDEDRTGCYSGPGSSGFAKSMNLLGLGLFVAALITFPLLTYYGLKKCRDSIDNPAKIRYIQTLDVTGFLNAKSAFESIDHYFVFLTKLHQAAPKISLQYGTSTKEFVAYTRWSNANEEISLKGAVQPRSCRERVMAMYETCRPEKLQNVDETLNDYHGREEALIEALVEKYGPEPPAALYDLKCIAKRYRWIQIVPTCTLKFADGNSRVSYNLQMQNFRMARGATNAKIAEQMEFVDHENGKTFPLLPSAWLCTMSSEEAEVLRRKSVDFSLVQHEVFNRERDTKIIYINFEKIIEVTSIIKTA